MIMKVNGNEVSAIRQNGVEFSRVMRNGTELWSGTGLPAGYRLLEYIQSSGSQYIDTGIYPTEKTGITIDAIVMNSSTAASAIFGAKGSGSPYVLYYIDSQRSSLQFGDYSSYLSSPLPLGTRVITRFENGILYSDGTAQITATTSSFTSDKTLCLMYDNKQLYCIGKIYSCQIHENGTIIRDFIPCMNEANVCGLFDKVNEVFYPSASSTAFTGSLTRSLPGGYVSLEYIQSSGTQYVDTGYHPKYNSKVVVDVEGVGEDAQMLYGTRNTASSTASYQFSTYRSKSTAMRSDYFGTNASVTVSDVSGRMIVEKRSNVTAFMGYSITNTAVSSGTCAHPLYLLALNNIGSPLLYTTCKLYSCQIYDEGVLIRDYIPCMNDSGVCGLYDKVEREFHASDGTEEFTGT